MTSTITNRTRPAGWPRLHPGLGLLAAALFLLSGCGTAPKAPVSTSPPPPATIVMAQSPEGRLDQWRQLMIDYRNLPIGEKLVLVNNYFNQLEFRDDIDLWGVEDYWATPTETLRTSGGDCEDFTIAKYFTLRKLQVPDEQMRLTYVKSLTLNQPHMVLSFFQTPDNEPVLLDNLIDPIVPASHRTDLIPVYSFNGSGLWLAKRRENQPIRDASDLRLWRDLQARVRMEGWQQP